MSIIKRLTKRYTAVEIDAQQISGVAALINGLCTGDITQREALKAWLVSGDSGMDGESVVGRAAFAVLSSNTSMYTILRGKDYSRLSDPGDLQELLNTCLQRFGDKLYIQHTPIMLQEGMIAVAI